MGEELIEIKKIELLGRMGRIADRTRLAAEWRFVEKWEGTRACARMPSVIERVFFDYFWVKITMRFQSLVL